MCKKRKAGEPRQCYYVPAMQDDPFGFVPSLVTENELGHRPMTGGPDQTPWYWGKTIERAREVCARRNQSEFGINEKTAARIVASSMFAQNK